MASSTKLKKAARARQRETGERYTTALAHARRAAGQESVMLTKEQYEAWKGDRNRVVESQFLGLGYATFKEGETSARLSASVKEWNLPHVWCGRSRKGVDRWKRHGKGKLLGIVIRAVVLDSSPANVVRARNGEMRYSLRLDGGETMMLPPGFTASSDAPAFSSRPFLTFHETAELLIENVPASTGIITGALIADEVYEGAD